MTARALKAAVAVVVVLVGWLYLPPFGDRVSLPELEPLLDPGVPHAPPTFIDTGEHGARFVSNSGMGPVFNRVNRTQNAL